jgi:hypothetical protein
MAEFFPREPDEIWHEGDVRPSNAPELAFRRHLEVALADRPWIVVQNLVVQAPDRVGTREIDFLVIDPERGFIVIEVKGGNYRHEHDTGWFREVEGKRRIDKPGAVKQAIGAMYHLVHFLASKLFHQVAKPPYLHGWLVALPDAEIRADTLPPEAQGHVLDAKHCREPERLLANIEDMFVALQTAYPTVDCGERSCMGDVTRQFILPAMQVRFSVRDEIRNTRVIENDLLRPLRMVMDAASEMDRLLVRGYPGTGKTFAALHRARRDLDDGARVLVLCFNVPLAASLTARLRTKPVRATTPPEEIRGRSCVVARLHALAECAARHRASDGRAEPQAGGPEYYDAIVAELEHAAKDGLFGRFDSIVVDEGQDFTPAMLRALDALAGDCGRIAVFHDPNQCLYGGAPDSELAARFGRPLVLRENLRNSATITAFLRELDPARLTDLTSPPSVRNGQRVVVWEYAHGDTAGQVEAITTIVRHLTEGEDVRCEDIALLSPFKFERTSLAGMESLADLPLLALEDAARLGSDAPPCLRRETLHRFKGLEAPVVIMHDVAGGGANVNYEAILTGCSRAQHALYVLRSSDYRGEAALRVQGELPERR